MKYSNLCYWAMWLSLAGLAFWPDYAVQLLAAAFVFWHRAALETLAEKAEDHSDKLDAIRKEIKI